MRLLHVSDTHVGFSAYNRVTPEGLNQRERDFFDAFSRAIDLALAERVDAVLHSGDLFDSVRPTNRAVAFAMGEIRRLGEIPFVVLAGNHETPKLKETGSVLRFLDFLPNARAAYRGRREVVRVGEAAFHLVPHAPSEEVLRAQLDEATPDATARFNVLAFHAGVAGVADFRTGEFNEHVVPASSVDRPGFDYVALGHYHKPTALAPMAWYAGSTERTSFKEEPEPKGALLVDLARRRVEHRDLGARPMVTLPPLECGDLAEIEVMPALAKRLAGADLAGKIARLHVRRCSPAAYATIDFREVRRLAEPALHFQTSFDLLRGGVAIDSADARIGALAAEFDGYFARVPVEDLDRDRLAAKARALLEAAEAGGRS